MDHAITVSDLLMVGGIGVAVLILGAIAFVILAIVGSGWNH